MLCFSNLSVHVNHLETLLELGLRFSGHWPGCSLHVPPAPRAATLLIWALRRALTEDTPPTLAVGMLRARTPARLRVSGPLVCKRLHSCDWV